MSTIGSTISLCKWKQQGNVQVHIIYRDQYRLQIDYIFSITLRYDLRNKSLRANATATPEAEQLSNTWASFFKVSNNAVDGPFSRKVLMHENEEVCCYCSYNFYRYLLQLTIVGSRDEMKEFSEKCLKNTDIAIELKFPVLRAHLASKRFLEILYNRFGFGGNEHL
jgi:hypothetical protein